jgi:ribonuclease E
MSKQIIIAEQHRIAAVFSEEQIQEIIVAKGSHQVSDIYYGIVENVLPGIDAAFVNIGDSERNGFIHVTDLGPLRLKRSASAITDLLAPQQKVLVQVMKEPTGNKGPRLTGNVSLPGRYLVLMPYGRGVNLSRRIRSESERNRLRALAVLIKPAGMGVVVRTEAEGMAEEAIIEDLESLQRQWENILQEASTTRAPALLNRDDDFIQRVLRDTYSGDVNRIVVDSHTGLKRVKQHLLGWSGGKPPQGVLIDHHKENISVLEYFRVNAAIREALKPRVDLPSGGYIIIERTEALTVIDVNSGSFTRSATARETVLWTNYEAATEIARQLRLRNIAGVIIVDFIDMDARRDQLQLLEHFNKTLRMDKARPQIAQLTELGLVELTRKRQGQNIYELFGRPCPTCNGLGHLVCLPGQDAELGADPNAPPAAEWFDSGHEPSADAQPLYTETSRGGFRNRSRLSSTAPRDARSLRTPGSLPSKSIPWPARSEEGAADFEEDSLEPEFLHHPSYNERGGGMNRRRRRRRPPEIGRGQSPEGRDSTAEEAPYWEDAENRGTTNLETAIPSEESTLVPVKKAHVERHRSSRRGLPNGVDAKPSAAGKVVMTPQKEIVTVEMTAEEQEVYAWMGISPLVLANQEVKNPRSVVVAVTLPGQTPDLSVLAEDEPLRHSTASFSAPEAAPLANEPLETEVAAIALEPITAVAPPKKERIRRRSTTVVPTFSDEADEAVSAQEPVSSVTIPSEDAANRRRRRRSSAVSSEVSAPD